MFIAVHYSVCAKPNQNEHIEYNIMNNINFIQLSYIVYVLVILVGSTIPVLKMKH
jgi:hypothetical protein